MTRRQRPSSHRTRIATMLALLLVVGAGCAEKEADSKASVASEETASDAAADVAT